MSKCQRTDGFTTKLLALLYYAHTSTYKILNCNRPIVLLQFYTRRCFSASLSVRATYSGHPIMYIRKCCMNDTCNKINRWISVRSIQHHTLLQNPKILHTETFFLPACHQHKIYRCMAAKYTRNNTILHNPTILRTK